MPAQFPSRTRSGPQFGYRNPRRKQTSIADALKFDTSILAPFKLMPSYTSDQFKVKRPLMGECCQCMPTSRDDLIEASAMDNKMRNILDVKPELGNSGSLVTSLSELVYTMRRPLFGPFPDLSMAVLTNRRVIEAVQKTAKDMEQKHSGTDSFAAVERKAVKIINKMKASVSSVFIKFTGWFLLKFLSLMLRGVLVHRGQLAIVKKAAERGLPMIYLPLHRSHLDYVLITFILWNYDIRAPFVAAGDNMDIPFFSCLMRSLGGFFIRRRLDNGGNQKDILYRAILNVYMLELLKRGESMEFFIEGGRTRTGRAIIPKGGLLSVVVDACMEGIIHDAYVVPINISYDKILEGNFCTEQMIKRGDRRELHNFLTRGFSWNNGQRKQQESFLSACRGIIKTIMGDFGKVRVDFAQPFSVQEFIKVSQTFPPRDLPYEASLVGSYSCASSLNISQISASLSNSNMSGDGLDNNRAMVMALAEHTVYTCMKTVAPMSSHMLAFLFLTKCRQGGTQKNLAIEMDWLKEQLLVRNQDVGYCGKAEDAVLHAQSLLGEGLVTCSLTQDQELFLTPNLTMPSIFELSYNANSVLTSFVLESIMATAVLCEVGLSPSTWIAKNQVDQSASVRRESVFETAHEICNFLHAEFILVPPCMKLSDALVDKLEDFITLEILSVEESQYDRTTDLQERKWAARISKTLTWDDDDGDDDNDLQDCYVEKQMLKVNIARDDIREKLLFLQTVLAPVLESYLISALFLTQTLKEEIPEDDFFKQLSKFALEKVENNLVMYTESCAMLTLKNAVKAFQNLKILEHYEGGNLTMISLSENLEVRERLQHFIEILKVIRS